MVARNDWLETLLRKEHAAVLEQLAAADGPTELKQVADAALTLAGDLIALRSGARALNLRGVTLWSFPDLATFLQEFGAISGGSAALEAREIPALVASQRERGIFLLRQRHPGAGAVAGAADDGAILAVDARLVELDRLVGFLFALVLRRSATAQDVGSILGGLPPRQDDDAAGSVIPDPEQTAEVFRIIIDSVEATSAPTGWTWLSR
jgi:hypothetical protein